MKLQLNGTIKHLQSYNKFYIDIESITKVWTSNTGHEKVFKNS